MIPPMLLTLLYYSQSKCRQACEWIFRCTKAKTRRFAGGEVANLKVRKSGLRPDRLGQIKDLNKPPSHGASTPVQRKRHRRIVYIWVENSIIALRPEKGRRPGAPAPAEAIEEQRGNSETTSQQTETTLNQEAGTVSVSAPELRAAAAIPVPFSLFPLPCIKANARNACRTR